MTSLIFKTTSRFLIVITLIFSVWVLLRGHNSPGGGFIGGLIGASGLALYLLANGSRSLRRVVWFKFTSILSLGLILLMSSGLIALYWGRIYMTSVWFEISSVGVQIGTPIIFDFGVYLVVLSSVLMIILSLEESA